MTRAARALWTLLLLASAASAQRVLETGGPAASELAGETRFILVLFLIVAAVMGGLLILICLRPRGDLGSHAPVDIGGGQRWLLIGGFLVPAFVLATVFIVGLKGMTNFPLHDGNHHPADIRVRGHQWWWDIEYLGSDPARDARTANEIHIPSGQPVDIELVSADVIHSFWIPALHGKVDLVPGQANRIRIQAAQPGVYRGRCAEYCGAQHAHMGLIVVADAPGNYEQWLSAQLAPAREPASPEQAAGRDLFLNRACLLCHTIRGTIANSRVGPDLTHIGGRAMIAANTYRNETANLAAWVTHAQSMKPGVLMPNVTQFDGQELRALVAYLRSLR